MTDFETLFSSSVLSLWIPNTSIEFPPASSTDDWLARLKQGPSERKQAFFDEQLNAILTVQINLPLSDKPVSQEDPPSELLAFIAHLQITLEATYISSAPARFPDTPDTTRLSAPPRTSLGLKLNPRPGTSHPSIYPPNTPNPTPLTADNDKKYVQAEGTLLMASIWGQNTTKDEIDEGFCLLWSDEDQVWVAVYKLGLRVSFLQLKYTEPLLCLTVSETLREKPISLQQYPNHPLTPFFAKHGVATSSVDAPLPSPNGHQDDGQSNELNGLDEVNLLQGLACGPTFHSLPATYGDASASLDLPTTRLGIVSRRKLFALSPASLPSPVAPSPSPLTTLRTSHPTLRKSFRKTLGTASGFKVRMRTVFVPAVMLEAEDDDESEDDSSDDEEGSEQTAGAKMNDSGDEGEEDDDSDDTDVEKAAERKDLRESGNEERTVILSVEVENSGDSGPGITFEVEKVDVRIGGEGATSRLIGWNGDKQRDGASVFPLHIESFGQYNLLYAVSFLKSPDDMDGFSLSRDPSVAGAHNPDLQRAVSITVHGRPVVLPSTEQPSDKVYPTKVFASRWNCVLDLAASTPTVRELASQDRHPDSRIREALPEPASPFPVTFSGSRSPNPRNGLSSDGSDRRASVPVKSPSSSNVSPVAGLPPKRFSLPGGAGPSGRPGSGGLWRASTSMLNPSYQSSRESRPPGQPSPSNTQPNNRLSYVPPSVTVNAQGLQAPTTYGVPFTPGPQATFAGVPSDDNEERMVSSPIDGMPPPTPAYPSYPSIGGVGMVPPSQNPIVSQNTGNVGPKIDIKRAKGVGLGVNISGAGAGMGKSPTTPLPTVPGAFGEQTMLRELQRAEESGEAIVVSVGLLPTRRQHQLSGSLEKMASPPGTSKKGRKEGDGKIYPLETFTLDIFVFNQSTWTRRLEVSYPDQRSIRKGGVGAGAKDWSGSPGILPLDNRVRVGPLRPSTCQSVRMEFLALSPGVHSVDTLTLSDVESGFSMNLRSVMDIVVHEKFD
ncbi:hypothetical protein ONZ45_g7514 [Pleurotus djamor]|nr:hypothetical protein ONZ45_g7514 [Pleurotus djamor]